MNRMRLNRIVKWTLVAFVALWSMGCSESSNSGTCASSEECETYTSCVSGTCAEQECANASECDVTEVCVTNPEGKNVCTNKECTVSEDCPEGSLCFANVCVSGDAPLCSEEGAECLFGGDCCSKNCDQESKTCGPEVAACTEGTCEADLECNLLTGECEEPASCTADSCEIGTICNEETGICEENTGDAPYVCMECATEEDCGDIGACVSLGGVNSCLSTCVTNGDCDSGFKCFNMPAAGFVCVPGAFTCAIDCIQGCEDGKVCDQDSGACVPQLEVCDTCDKDTQCGVGFRCASLGGPSKQCVPECSSTGTCEGAAECVEIDNVPVCIPTSTECCFGSNCSNACGSEVCEPPTPYCLANTTCVECLNSSNCGGVGCTCDTETNTCSCPSESCGNCQEPTPVCNPQTQQCVECMTNEDCEQGEFCEQNSKTCTSDICDSCVDPYPACAEINGQLSCVQCVEDADCPSGQCNETTYFCEGTSGQLADTCKCQTDSDCPTGTQFTLKCDTSLGLCYDIEGNCDGISACCHVDSGSTCVSVFDLLGSGGLPAGLPLPGGATGFCSCDPLGDICGSLPIPGLCGEESAGECLPGQQCDPIGALLGGLLGGGGGDAPSSFCSAQ